MQGLPCPAARLKKVTPGRGLVKDLVGEQQGFGGGGPVVVWPYRYGHFVRCL